MIDVDYNPAPISVTVGTPEMARALVYACSCLRYEEDYEHLSEQLSHLEDVLVDKANEYEYLLRAFKGARESRQNGGES